MIIFICTYTQIHTSSKPPQKMVMYICRRIISLPLKIPNPSSLYKRHLPFSFSLLFSFSSSAPQERVMVADYLQRHHQFSPETVSKLLSTAKFLKNPDKSDSILSFLKESGLSTTHLEQLIKRAPQVLSSNLDLTIKPKIKVFQDLGLSPIEIAEIVSLDPWLFNRAADRLGPSFLLLRGVLGSHVGVTRLLTVCTWFLKRDLEKTLLPNIEFLKSCGVSSSQIVKYLYNFPRFFLRKHEDIKEYVKRVDEMGLDRKSKMFLHAIRAISSMTVENWELRLGVFRSLGFSEDDIASVFKRVPQVFTVSERKIKEVTHVLLGAGEFDISFIVRHPELLIFSLEKRIKPRLRVLEVLESKNLLSEKPRFTRVFKLSDKSFYMKFVLPYRDEVGEFFPFKEA